jgi:hypothetical protein
MPVFDDLGAPEIDVGANLVGVAAEHADELIEWAGPGHAEHVAEQRRRLVREQLLGTAQPA